ncbi:MAG: hypothetical protein PHO18_02585 [Synergistaceae bacterium]|nr:hypothetical protein [Synergistaceae bacterium]
MAFKSIMYPDDEYPAIIADTPPEYFNDLNLDKIIEAVISENRLEYLRGYYQTPVASARIILYRQMTMKELYDRDLFNVLLAFSENIRDIESRHIKICGNLDSGASYRNTVLEKSRLYAAAFDYCSKVKELRAYLTEKKLKSEGLKSFLQSLSVYTESENFISIEKETRRIRDIFSSLIYTINIDQNKITVDRYSGEREYKNKIERIFEKFKDNENDLLKFKKIDDRFAEHVETGILNIVAARIYRDEFSQIETFCNQYWDFIAPSIKLFAKEIMFYIAYLNYTEKFKNNGLRFCIPELTEDLSGFFVKDAFDPALAEKLIRNGAKIVCNDISVNEKERIIIVTGANQGGKTTFARMFGQISYLASLGCCVPGACASLSVPDNIFTHFEKQENILSLEGKLSEDILRINSILSEATSKSVIIVNEFLSSTSADDAIAIGKDLLERISRVNCLCLFVTFIYELYENKDNIVSMKVLIEQENPEKRTYKIVREKPDGKAYAFFLAEKFRITEEALIERIK